MTSLRPKACSQLEGNFVPQETSDNVWRPMRLSWTGAGMLLVSGDAKHPPMHRTDPTTNNYPAQHRNGAEAVKPRPKETRTQKAELEFRLPLRSLPKSLLSPRKWAVWSGSSSSEFFDSPYLPVQKILQDLLILPTPLLSFSTNSFFLPRWATLGLIPSAWKAATLQTHNNHHLWAPILTFQDFLQAFPALRGLSW